VIITDTCRLQLAMKAFICKENLQTSGKWANEGAEAFVLRHLVK